MVQQNFQEEGANSEEPTQRRDIAVRSENLRGNFKGNRKSPNLHNLNMTQKPEPIFGRFKVTSSIAITMNLEFNYVPKEETFPIPLK